MDIGIPRERSGDERRVALTPACVHRLVAGGHRVWVEQGAGIASRITDDDFLRAGARSAYDTEEVYRRAELLLKVASPTEAECALLHEGQILMAFLMLAVAPPATVRALLDRKVSAVAMELIEDERGRAPVLEAISDMAGPLAIQTAAHLLQSDSGGRGILLGGAPGINPATVVILGAGVAGSSAARAAIGHGAQVFVLDRDLARLKRLHELYAPRVRTWLAEEYEIARAVQFADVLVGAVQVRGDRAPHLVSEAMVKTMKPGAVIIDLSIDQGGCAETSRPTSLREPTFVLHDVVHCAVPNLASAAARTATYALTNARIPYVTSVADHGLARTCAADAGFARGLVAAQGRCFHPLIAERFGIPCDSVRETLATIGAVHDGP